MTILDNIKKLQSYTLTENGALALNTTSDDLTDLFAVSGAMRSREDNDIMTMFSKAFTQDRLLATKLAFYTRDVRGGLGERRTGRLMFRFLARYYPDVFNQNVAYVAEYGRWDDLVWLLDDAPEVIVPLLKKQLEEDVRNMAEGKPVSLLAKWLPSVNTSGRDAVARGRYLAKRFGMSEKEYRKTLSALRKYINVVEVNMSTKNYGGIVYPEVPSRAMNIYRNAFKRNDEDRFNEFLKRVEEGEAKINSSVLYPYDITEKYLYQRNPDDRVLEAQWNALPDYVEGENRFLVMADVSGSMYGRPLATSVGLAMYFAERNKGPFAGKFMTFSARPELVEIKGETLGERLRYIQNADWDMNTDLEAAFELLLQSAVKFHAPKEEMPASVIVITDMEFDRCVRGGLFYDTMKQRFNDHGYDLPNVVFWNVSSRHETYHVSSGVRGIQLASGQSAAVFESLVKGVGLTPYDYMLTVLNAERYSRITV